MEATIQKNAVSEPVGPPLLQLFAKELKTEDILKQLVVGTQQHAVDMTSWEDIEDDQEK